MSCKLMIESKVTEMLDKIKEGILMWLISYEVKDGREEFECCSKELDIDEPVPEYPNESKSDGLIPIKRYRIIAGGLEVFCDDYKFGDCGTIETIQITKTGGVDKVIYGIIFEPAYMIFDNDSILNPEEFGETKSNSFDSKTQKGEEVLDQRNALSGICRKPNPNDTSIVSSYA
jgi:hypothetical protein